jgi:Transposase IS116/IS110/IS902 family
MPYRIAGIDVHKKMLAVVVSDVEIDGEYQFERRRFSSSPDHLRLLAEWLIEQEVEEVVMELLKLALDELHLIEQHIALLDQAMASLLTQHQDAVQRLAEVPGLGVDSAHQIIAEVGATAATFPSDKHLASWIGACPGDEESAGVSRSHRCPKGNRNMRRLLSQCANAAVKLKGSIFQILYRRLLPRLGHNQAIGAVAHKLCRLIWMILHQGIRYEERGPAVTERSRRVRITPMIRILRKQGYRVEPPVIQLSPTA